MFRLLGHEGSVLALMVIKEKGWLVSSSSEFGHDRVVNAYLQRDLGAGDVRVGHRSLTVLHIMTSVRSGVPEPFNPFTSFILVTIHRAVFIRLLGTVELVVHSTSVSQVCLGLLLI